jgi:hypothetical protein
MQGIEALFPLHQVPIEPVIDLGERLRAETVDPPLCVLADLDESRFSQYAKVPGDARAGNR